MLNFILFSCAPRAPYELNETGLGKFITDYESQIEPLTNRRAEAEWNAYTTGSEEEFERLTRFSLVIDSLHQNKQHFEYLQELRRQNVIRSPLLQRQLDLVLKEYMSRQMDPVLNQQITELSTRLQNTYANFRTEYDGQTYSDNQVTQILKSETKSGVREKIWRAQKKLGEKVAADLVKLAGLRNKAARELGYADYFQMRMDLTEMDPALVEQIFAELSALSAEPYRQACVQIEDVFCKRYGISGEQMRPWHYEDLFAQEVPSIYQINLDSYYTGKDIPALARNYFESLAIPVEDILQRSDLYERPGKNQHAFSFNIDRKQDIRILCNIVPDMRWMETMLHELGHGIYDKYLDQTLPFLLREPAHAFTTEGIANLFGGQAADAAWMARALNLSAAERKKIETTTRASSRLSKLIFARWSLVVFNFEKWFYADPGQDLNKLWWDLVEKYQYIKRPENLNGNEWATKIHIATYPVYYHNYQLGELFASQILNHLMEKYGIESFWDQPATGRYLQEEIFFPGKKLPWADLVVQATGEPLTAKYFVQRYIQ
jgi:peptidyl-dipeptidase A